ncbi:hypothetical protein C0Q70_08724 [Pomacea canaliculata]|uniref:Uncharacterized protein n=1 Tax=Pomacea canaliculata TaxID=400727 RepID=A0A2T7P7U6_POMCA|nr:hypothetical protein C0Q70_08724 [Pomacea canaliculata]
MMKVSVSEKVRERGYIREKEIEDGEKGSRNSPNDPATSWFCLFVLTKGVVALVVIKEHLEDDDEFL